MEKAEMKIIAISDTHNQHSNLKLPDGDVLIHAGDATGRGTEKECIEFLDWFQTQEFKHKIFTPGNHDWWFEREPENSRAACKDRGIILLNDSGIEIDGVKFWGSPITPWFLNWAFNRIRGDKREMYCMQTGVTVSGQPIKPHWDLIPSDTNVLITHGPPYGILDQLIHVASGIPMDIYVGCEELTKAIKRIKPDIHIFGHIHPQCGEKHEDGVSYYNASICDEMYYPSNSPHIIEL